MQVVQVPAAHAETLWYLADPLLERAIACSHGSTSAERVLSEILSGAKQLWFVAPEDNVGPPIAAGVTSLRLNEDGSKTANIELMGGDGMKKWFDLRPVLEAWARAEGCKDIRFWGRKEWARLLPDYKITCYVMRKEL